MTQFTAYQKKQLGLFAMLTLAFLSLFTVLYARNRDNTLLSLLMLTPALSALIVNRLTHERRSLFLRPKFKRNLSRYALSWFLPPLLAFAGAGLYFLIFPSQFQPLASRFAVNNGTCGAGCVWKTAASQSCCLRFFVNPFGGLIPALGEELAWRGWLLPRLRECPGHAEEPFVATSFVSRDCGMPRSSCWATIMRPDHPLLGVLMQLWLCLIQGDHPGLAAAAKPIGVDLRSCGMRPSTGLTATPPQPC